LSTRILHPFVIPSDVFTPFVGKESVRSYDFLDPVIYLKDQRPDSSFVKELELDPSKQLVVFREEEYKASYVGRSMPFAYEALAGLQSAHNVVILPRYGTSHLETLFPKATVLYRTIDLSRLLPFADLFIGGGGTINIEAAWWGVPVISTRSFVSHYDRYLLDNELMIRATSTDSVLRSAERVMGRMSRDDPLKTQVVDMDSLVRSILED
jgi:predicted glycosyltransferase